MHNQDSDCVLPSTVSDLLLRQEQKPENRSSKINTNNIYASYHNLYNKHKPVAFYFAYKSLISSALNFRYSPGNKASSRMSDPIFNLLR